MNVLDIVLITAVAAALSGAVWLCVRGRRKGNTCLSCSGGCSSCGMHCSGGDRVSSDAGSVSGGSIPNRGDAEQLR